MGDEENITPETNEDQSAPVAPTEASDEAAATAEPLMEEETSTPDVAPDSQVPNADPTKLSEAPKADAPRSEGGSAPAKKGERRDIFKELDPTDGEQPKILKAKGSKNITGGIVHIQATFNNTIVSVTDSSGNVLGWSSAGKMGFRGSRKSTAYAAQLVSQDACRQAMSHGLKEAEVRVKGPGSGRESAVRAVQSIGIDVTTILDVTPIPHNGCRPPKARRV